MRNKSLLIVITTLCILTALLVIPAMAQDDWSVYLFNGNTGELIQVKADGTQSVSALGLEAGTYIGSSDMSFTKDGSRLAFCALTSPTVTDPNSTAQPTAKFYLRDLAAQNYLLTLDMGNAIGCRTGEDAFNADATQVAVSKINYYPGDPAADTSKPAWEILILDIAGGMTVKELNVNSPSVAAFESLVKGSILPYVQYFANNQVIFAEVPYGIGGGAEWNAYLWDLTTDTVEPIERWGNLGLDTLDTSGEVIWTAKDESRAAAQPGGPVPDHNVVKLADKSGEERIIYYSPDWVVLNAKFINNGQQIAIQLLSAFDENNPDIIQSIKWVALDRAGNTVDLLSSSGNLQLEAAPNGYIVLDQQLSDANNGESQFHLSYVSNGQSNELWASQTGFEYWELPWVTPMVAASDLQPFPAIA
jgi:hypothetical protein